MEERFSITETDSGKVLENSEAPCIYTKVLPYGFFPDNEHSIQ